MRFWLILITLILLPTLGSAAPASLRLEGKMLIKTDFGAPGYGRNLATDERVLRTVLELDQPIEIEGSSQAVHEVTLVFSKNCAPRNHARNWVGSRVEIVGTLLHAKAIDHHSQFALMTSQISLKE